jgi:hypothetical protein
MAVDKKKRLWLIAGGKVLRKEPNKWEDMELKNPRFLYSGPGGEVFCLAEPVSGTSMTIFRWIG